jgi:hypothetical protein
MARHSSESADAHPEQAADVDATVDRWFADSFHGSIVARDTDAFNHLHAAVQKLKELLKRSG